MFEHFVAVEGMNNGEFFIESPAIDHLYSQEHQSNLKKRKKAQKIVDSLELHEIIL